MQSTRIDTISIMSSAVVLSCLFVIEFGNSAMSTAMGLPFNVALQRIGDRVYGRDEGGASLIFTKVEIVSSTITFVVSAVFVAMNANTPRTKSRMLMMACIGQTMEMFALAYMKLFIDTITSTLVYALVVGHSLLGGKFLLETCISDSVAAVLPKASKRRRTSVYMWLKSVKLMGVVMVQMIAPRFLDERQMFYMLTPIASAIMLLASILFVIVAQNYTDGSGDYEDDGNVDEKVAMLEKFKHYSRSLTVDHFVLFAIITTYCAQRGEYKFTFFFLKDHLKFTPANIRLINGCQYCLFVVSLFMTGVVMHCEKRPIVTMIAFLMSMSFSTAARMFQIWAWTATRLDVWVASAVMSTMGPIAQQVLQGVLYKTLDDARLSGLVMLTCDKFLPVPIVWIYNLARDSPFYVTLCLMIVTTIGGISTKRMRNWMMK
ncbi:hypothetical protein SlsnVgp101 [Spodoptera littoralis nucleopolyhedrovirus]|uniref:Uncharacterized protein n=1 Tax=Spodoptera littoralis nuclear polyhedrosis virus TaxID=10456 RepID=M1K3Y5_NPVSL|nr:hypothetical protein SlsnVgp101 [Spodoptera littoralis nucleopolyhedrovirus]AGE89956.1 hypothetical protein SlsnVgp101 [Spodoptera littoralis nucleopolyhedrovirus]AYU75289.1 hypothetical protein [Spodoptera littoralis nucleopolyhedrovirus]